jgi:hypothetical protein
MNHFYLIKKKELHQKNYMTNIEEKQFRCSLNAVDTTANQTAIEINK